MCCPINSYQQPRPPQRHRPQEKPIQSWPYKPNWRPSRPNFPSPNDKIPNPYPTSPPDYYPSSSEYPPPPSTTHYPPPPLTTQYPPIPDKIPQPYGPTPAEPEIQPPFGQLEKRNKPDADSITFHRLAERSECYNRG